MNIDKDDINKIIACIKKESENFFKNDMLLNILDMKSIPNYIPRNHFSSIELSNHIKLIISLDIDDDLFEVLFNKFFKDGVQDDEKDELIDALPDEIINIIVGLSIRNFPNNYKELVLSLPLELEKAQIQEMINKTVSQSCKIITNKGSLVCTVIYGEI